MLRQQRRHLVQALLQTCLRLVAHMLLSIADLGDRHRCPVGWEWRERDELPHVEWNTGWRVDPRDRGVGKREVELDQADRLDPAVGPPS